MNPAKLPGAAQNPFTGGCDFSAFEFPGLPSFGGGLGDLLGGGFAEDTLCDLAEGLINPMINGVNNNMLGNIEMMLFDVTGQTLTSDGQVINTGGSVSDPANFLDTVNQIKNILNTVE